MRSAGRGHRGRTAGQATAESGGAAATSATTTASTASIWCSSRRSCVAPSPRPLRRWRSPRTVPRGVPFLTRLQGEVIKRGTIDVLRNGIKHGALHLDLFYGTPSAENPQAQERFEQNRFTVTRQPSLQPGRGAAGAGHRAVHQRVAGVHLRAEEQPHEADGGRRGPSVSAGSQPAREAVRVWALHRALRGGRA